MLTDDQQRKVRKLQALAKFGVGGEKTNAARMLRRILKSEGISERDFDGEPMVNARFTYSTADQRDLLLHVFLKVAGSETCFYLPRGKRQICARIPKNQRDLIDSHYSRLRRELAKSMELLFTAFLVKNDLLIPREETAPEDTSPHDPEEIEQLSRLFSALDKTHLHLELDEPGTE